MHDSPRRLDHYRYVLGTLFARGGTGERQLEAQHAALKASPDAARLANVEPLARSGRSKAELELAAGLRHALELPCLAADLAESVLRGIHYGISGSAVDIVIPLVEERSPLPLPLSPAAAHLDLRCPPSGRCRWRPGRAAGWRPASPRALDVSTVSRPSRWAPPCRLGRAQRARRQTRRRRGRGANLRRRVAILVQLGAAATGRPQL